jgi:hypothetical protein
MKSPLNTREIEEKGNFSNIRSNDIPDQFSEKCTHGNWWVRQDLFVKAVKALLIKLYSILDLYHIFARLLAAPDPN